MSEFNERFAELTADQRRDRYGRLAEAALAHYPAGSSDVILIQHNGGIAYRVETRPDGRRFLLKIAEPIGEGAGVPPERLRSVLGWISALSHESSLVVQEPVANRQGDLLTAVLYDDLSAPFYSSLQRWIDGERQAGDFTPVQAFGVGVMMARLHEHGSQWMRTTVLDAQELDAVWLDDQARVLGRAVDGEILSTSEWITVEGACERIRTVMGSLGRGPEVWGPLHGDLHQGNLLFFGEEVRPIDFGGFTVGHHLYDLGTTLYHLMYLPVTVRQALIDGYQTRRGIGEISDLGPEAFVCAAALANLAFQVTIPSQRTSSVNVRNLHEFANRFCRQLVEGEPFVFF